MATLPAACGTAANALFYGLQPFIKGMTIVTLGTGGASAFAIQLTAAAGAALIAPSSSDLKLEIARGLGATHLVNYRRHSNWADEVLRLTSRKGVDHVLDVGGAGTIEQSIKVTRHGGLISLIRCLSEGQPSDIVTDVLFGAKTLRSVLKCEAI